ncbi:hypothetical protein B0H10DRAFT_1953071 [Mycena sp. CBHHK59/15]|nr:hypothetical protein B0H10DRAFT_1953071 [Mycena sp. CBHHK59/15]
MSRGSTREPSVSKTRNSRMTWVSVIFWSSSQHSVGTGQVLMLVSVSVGGHLRFEDPDGKSNGIVFTVLGNKPFVYFRFGNGGLEFFESHKGRGEVRSKCRLWEKHARSNDLECVFRFIESFLLFPTGLVLNWDSVTVPTAMMIASGAAGPSGSIGPGITLGLYVMVKMECSERAVFWELLGRFMPAFRDWGLKPVQAVYVTRASELIFLVTHEEFYSRETEG